jgi:hypothetical protein
MTHSNSLPRASRVQTRRTLGEVLRGSDLEGFVACGIESRLPIEVTLERFRCLPDELVTGVLLRPLVRQSDHLLVGSAARDVQRYCSLACLDVLRVLYRRRTVKVTLWG